MPPSDFLKAFQAGKAPRNVRLIAARGVAPVVPSEMIEVLVMLCNDEDSDIAALARRTLADWTEDNIARQLRDPGCAPQVLEHFSLAAGPDSLREAIIGNRATPATAVAKLALEVPPHLLELILDNRVRILESPEILENIKRNRAATPQILRQVHEIEHEFFSGKKSGYSVGTADQAAPAAEAPVEYEAEVLADDLILEGLPVDERAREAALSERLLKMSVRQKVKLALMGPREARTILIRDANRMVAMSVLESPKLSDSEIETYASMRNVTDEILRHIGNSKELTRTYAVAHALVRNPKTPPMTAQRMLSRLTTRDLSLLVRDRGIPEIVRRNAQRILEQRAGASARR